MRIVDQTEMREIEQVTFNEYGLSETVIVESVGINVARKIRESFIEKDSEEVTVIFLIGMGNNGADGLAIARHLTNRGCNVRAFLLAPKEKVSNELKKQSELANKFGVKISIIDNAETLASYFYQNMRKHIVVDAIYGTGTRLPLSDFDYSIIKTVNENSQFNISIDLPSGVDPSSGEVQGAAIRADLTYAIGFPKVGCYISEGSEHSGHVETVDVGFPKELGEQGSMLLAQEESILETIKQRSRFGDKKIFGHTLVIGGSHGLTGALVLASQAALKVGTGLVTGATWEPQYQEFISRLIPEVMTGYIPSDEGEWKRVLDGFSKYDSVVIGPGMGRSSQVGKVVDRILTFYDGPIVLDADAINVLKLKEHQDFFQKRRSPTVLTPHFGELARFLDVDYSEIVKDPISHLKEAVNGTNSFIILKGPCTYLGCPSGNIYFNYFPNSGMATGGAGDVLAGLLGGVLAQDSNLRDKVSLYQKIVSLDKTILLAMLVHSKAGFFAAQELGERVMTASSIIDSLPDAFDVLESEGK